MASFFEAVKIFLFGRKPWTIGRKPWTIVHGFVFESPKKVLRKIYHSKGSKNRSLMALVSVAYVAPSSGEL